MTSLAKLVFADINKRHLRMCSEAESVSTELKDFSLSLAFENLFFMPYDIIEKFSGSVTTLDISHNKFSRNLQFLNEFENLTSLNLDNNQIDSYTIFPYLPKLELLWLNHNNIDELYPFLKNLYDRLPNLRYLCLMGNKSAPSYLNGGTFYDYLQYRLFVISWFPRLDHLDDRTVTSEQRSEARRLFKRPLFECLGENASFLVCMKQIQNTMNSIFTMPQLTNKESKPKESNFIV